MACSTCSRTSSFRSISTAMAKAAAARLRGMGALRTSVDWAGRAAVCERCPLRVVRGGVSYCGTPFLHQIDRDPTIDGCGCPTRDKARAPGEHCPINDRHLAASREGGRCSCKWCALADQAAGAPVRFASLSST
jgi:hypothetical protein